MIENTPFKRHGHAVVEVAGPIVTVHMRGNWNLEMRDHTALELKAEAQALNAVGPWGIINHLHDTLAYSDVFFARSRADYAARSPSSRLAAVAFVIAPALPGAVLLREKFEALLTGVIESAVFSTHTDATQWLLARIKASAAKAETVTAAPGLRPHGHVELMAKGSILHAHIHGSWNVEMHKLFLLQVIKLSPALDAQGPWAVINHFHDTLVHGDEVFKRSQDAFKGRPPESRLVAVGFDINAKAEGYALLQERFETYLNGIIPNFVSTDATRVEEWVLEQIATAQQAAS